MYLDLSKPHFTIWNGKIHIFQKIVIILCVVSWYLQHLRTGACFCQNFVWCLCKKATANFSSMIGGEGQLVHNCKSALQCFFIFWAILTLVFSSSKLTYQSTLQLLLCCHLFDYTWSVALTLQSYLQQLGRLIAVIVDVAGQGQSQLRSIPVEAITRSESNPFLRSSNTGIH